MAFAGLWERWSKGESPALHTFTILTTEAIPSIRPIHPRMPVILPPSAWASWFDPASDPGSLRELLRPFRDGQLNAHPVSTLVNSPRNDEAACIEAVGDPLL
jgi:putative SOS response-associated peptidase YedK